MTPELQPYIEWLVAKAPWLTTLAFLVTGLRFALKPFSKWIQAGLSRAVMVVTATPQIDDDAVMQRFLGSVPYRLFAFLVDWGCSVKLPTVLSLQTAAAVQRRKSNGHLAALLLAVLWLTGCATLAPIAPGHDPLVVHAEELRKASFEHVTRFLKWEAEWRPVLPAKVTGFADTLRDEYPFWLATLKNETKRYKAARGEKADLQSAVDIMEEILRWVRLYMVDPDAAPDLQTLNALQGTPEL